MAYAMLKGLGAPREVSAATIDAQAGKGASASGCTISNVTVSASRVEFDRLDEGLPFNVGLFFNLRYAFVPLPDELNRYMLTVTGLAAGKYEIRVNDRSLGAFAAEALGKGVNIASATADAWVPGGPWDAQGWALNYLTEARNETVSVLKYQREYLETNPDRESMMRDVAAINAKLEQAQRRIAKPVTYHFVIAPASK
jgi:hypothetical protein